ncbi:MAG: phosphoribosyltransferase, partial [Okeania sp. SIO2D1]|nr:phosphoribosyltransferase [Okeania sp. SIO2D1]
QEIQELKTAVLWYKACSIFEPDYYVDYLPDNPWVHQPFEIYEQISAADLAFTLTKMNIDR